MRSKARLPNKGVCAHRGASGTHPENTLASFREANRIGAHMIEFDVALTSDEQVIVFHDATVERTTNGTGKVATLTLNEMKTLDAGSWKSPEFEGETIPTLEEALSIMPVNVWLNIHVKGGPVLAEKVVKQIVVHDRVRQSVLACSATEAAAAKGIDRRINVCNMDRQTDSLRYVDETIAMRAEFIQLIDLASLNPTHFRKLKEGEVCINYFCANNAEQIRDLFDSGVDFPLVDNVFEMVQVAAELGIKQNEPFYRHER